ncbi:MAG: hypothetical protein LBS26_01925 [Campylobacteraceae bacterium]|jgi:hypothetical protein|nr:hypothetical protein [Campylobacteraceae bacterium]
MAVKKFNLYAAKILTYLYENFPTPKDIDTYNFVKKEDMDEEIPMKYYDNDETYINLSMEPDATGNTIPQDEVYNRICSNTIWWLENEGFISFAKPDARATGANYDGFFLRVVITGKGLTALQKGVLCGDESRPIIEIIKEAIINNSMNTIWNLPSILYKALNL